MNAKTAQQIENLKNQTIGVEIEMNNITRNKAAKIAAEFFGTDDFKDTASRNGYQTWSAWDAQGREWKFQKDVSIAGPDSEKCELVTPILHYEDIETLQELVRRLRKAGAISHAGVGAGVHCHIGANGHTPQSLRNLANLMASHERLIADALKIDQGRINRYCRTVNPNFIEQLNKKKPTTMAQLADIWYTANDANYGRNQHYNESRYHMLNYHATFTKATIEFRCFNFDKPANGKKNGLHAGQLKSWIQLCLALSEMAKELRTASPKPQQTENPKFAMRTWLIRLGLVGEEFSTARDFLTRNLEGDKANGSIIEVDGKKYGCELLGQQYTDDGHMWGRIMNIDISTYKDENGKTLMYASPSNLSPASEEYEALVKERVEKLQAANPDMDETTIPVDLVTCSGSGLDPHISTAAAEYQVARIAKANHIAEDEVREIIDECTDGRFLGIFGEETVNVLERVHIKIQRTYFRQILPSTVLKTFAGR